ncbi:MAG TPA: RNA-guided endonuclease TnpB family protein [Ktedonobacterales bacterium]|jgi:putative transposase
MLIVRAYKAELDLNNTQVTACKKHAGAARWAYNWGLRRKQEVYEQTGKTPTAVDLHRELNALKVTDVPWMYEVSKCAPQEALRNLDTAFTHFFRRCQHKQRGVLHGKLGYPKSKSRKKGLGSFRLTGSILVFPTAIQLPRLGHLRLKEHGYLPTFGVKILAATVSEHGGHWYIALHVEQEHSTPAHTGPIVGVDLGVKTLATISDGTRHETVANPKHLRCHLRKVKRLHKAVTRKLKGSRNRKKAATQLGKAYRRIANRRTETLHQMTTRLAKTKSVVVIEDLNVSGMLQNRHLARAIADVGFAEFRRQLAYKAQWYGSRVVVVSRWEPSSRRCSRCGHVKANLLLSERTYHCDVCELTIERDVNAAINLLQLADSSPDSLNACGEERAGLSRERQVKRSPMNQELDTLPPLVGYSGNF